MTQFTITSGETQLAFDFPENLRSEEMADLLKIIAICLYDIDMKEALLHLELLRDRPPFYGLSQEENSA